jgi:zinc protease
MGGYMIVAPQNLAKAKASMLDEISKMATSGSISAEELTRAKDTWIKEQDTNLGNDGYVAGMLENQLFRGHTMDFSRKLRASIQAVTVDDVARVAKARIKPDKLIVVDAGDEAKAKQK